MWWVRRPTTGRIEGLSRDERSVRQVSADCPREGAGTAVLDGHIRGFDDARRRLAVVGPPYDKAAELAVGVRCRVWADDRRMTDIGKDVVTFADTNSAIARSEKAATTLDETPGKCLSGGDAHAALCDRKAESTLVGR